jgi:trk system potassium uptake protein TrkH
LFFLAVFVAFRWGQVNWSTGSVWQELRALLASQELRTLLASSSVQAINSRTAGMPLHQFLYDFPRTMQWALIAAMILGASSGGTSGGIKTTTLAEICRGTRRALRGQHPGRPMGIALVWLGIYLALAAAIMLCLLVTESDMPADRVLFLAISAVSNVGLSHDQLQLSPAGQYLLSAAMLAGRMTPLLILWWMADTTEEADRAIG